MIYGERIRLRMVEKEDLPAFKAWWNDPEVRHGLSWFLPLSTKMQEDWFENNSKRPAEEQALVLEIKQGSGWQMIGNIELTNFNWVARSAEVGIMIGEKGEWNKGYGSEAMKLILKHGFETLNLNRISLRVFSDNPNAIRSYEKVGFVIEGVQRQARYSDGQYHDVLLMSMLRDDYA